MIEIIILENYMSYHKIKGKEKVLRSFIRGLFILDMMLYLMMLMEVLCLYKDENIVYEILIGKHRYFEEKCEK